MFPVDRGSIQEFGRRACNEITARPTYDKARDELKNFVASEHWAENSTFRHGLCCKTLHGEAGSVDDASIAQGMREVRNATDKYDAECIFDVN